MKINKNKLYDSMNYIVEINQTNLLKIDFSDLFDDGIDLTNEQKNKLFFGYEHLTNIEIINKALNLKK